MNNRWLLGETIIGGLCNQLFGVYSIIPTARYLNADGVVVGPMHSRFDNYEIDYKVVVPVDKFFKLVLFTLLLLYTGSTKETSLRSIFGFL